MEPAILDARPERCPKGHPIWWFAGGADAWHARTRGSACWWGVCSGRRTREGDVLVSGACRTCWYWSTEEGRLLSVPDFDPQALITVLRKLAHRCEIFSALDGGERESP
jgi:hypothetical protein